jgi:hypothetical protein
MDEAEMYSVLGELFEQLFFGIAKLHEIEPEDAVVLLEQHPAFE